MVTEKDLYVGMNFKDISLTQYCIIKIDDHFLSVLAIKGRNPIVIGIKTLIDFVNKNTWKILTPINKVYELW